MEGKPSWRLLLIGLSRFPRLTRPICSADLKRERATSKVAGQARLRGAEEVGRRARGWSHSSSHSLFVTGGQRAPAVTPLQEHTHTHTLSSMCSDNAGAGRTHSKQEENKKSHLEQLL